jgi:hypothetical protein
MSVAADVWRERAAELGLPADGVGRPVIIGHLAYGVVGLFGGPAATPAQVVVERHDGYLFLAPVTSIAAAFAAEKHIQDRVGGKP